MSLLATIAASLIALAPASAQEDGRAPERAGVGAAEVFLRIRSWPAFEQGDGIYRVLFSEVRGEERRMAPLAKMPPNAFEVGFLPSPAEWPTRAGDFYPFRFRVKPGRYAISFVFWANRAGGGKTAVSQDITASETLLFTVAEERVTYLGDFRLRFDDLNGRASQVVRHLGHGLETEMARDMHRAAPEILSIACPLGTFGASRRTCMKAAMDGQKYAAPQALLDPNR